MISVSKSVREGSIQSIGDFIAHHIIEILSHGRWINSDHALNTAFSHENGTSLFICKKYNLNSTKTITVTQVM